MITRSNFRVFIVIVLAMGAILAVNLASIYSVKPQLGPVLKPAVSSKVINKGMVQDMKHIIISGEHKGF